MSEDHLLPNRLNAEPPIFRGCSLSELMWLSGTGALFWIPFWLLVCGLFGFLMLGVGVGMLSMIATVFFGSIVLQKLKRGRPHGFYQLRLRLMLEDKGLMKKSFIREARVWDVGRTL